MAKLLGVRFRYDEEAPDMKPPVSGDLSSLPDNLREELAKGIRVPRRPLPSSCVPLAESRLIAELAENFGFDRVLKLCKRKCG